MTQCQRISARYTGTACVWLPQDHATEWVRDDNMWGQELAWMSVLSVRFRYTVAKIQISEVPRVQRRRYR